MRYMTRIDPDFMSVNSKEAKQAIAERLYGLLQQNPYISLEELTKDLLETYRKNTDKLMKSKEDMAQSAQGSQTAPPAGTPNSITQGASSLEGLSVGS